MPVSTVNREPLVELVGQLFRQVRDMHIDEPTRWAAESETACMRLEQAAFALDLFTLHDAANEVYLALGIMSVGSKVNGPQGRSLVRGKSAEVLHTAWRRLEGSVKSVARAA